VIGKDGTGGHLMGKQQIHSTEGRTFMKHGTLIALLTALCLLGGASLAGAQGLYWESTMSGSAGTSTDTSVSYYMPKMFKIVQGGGEKRIMLFRLDREVMYMINPEKKTYSEITFAEIEKQMTVMSKQLDEKMAEMKKQMESMPPEQRKMVEAQMGMFMKSDDPKMKPQVVNTGERSTISGFSATKYVARKGENVILTVWATKDVKGWAAMKNDFEQFSKRMSSLSQITDGISEAYRTIEGFPVRTEMGSVVNTVTKVERRSTPVSQFEVPAGYTRVEPSASGGSQ
jgi:hypothetical protein